MAENHSRRIAFVSPCALCDPTSGAAVATLRALEFLGELGHVPSAFCGAACDAPRPGGVAAILAARQIAFDRRRVVTEGYQGNAVVTQIGRVPMTVFDATPQSPPDGEELAAMMLYYMQFLDRRRPDVVLAYGSDPITAALLEITAQQEIPVVIWLHNFAYTQVGEFTHVDYAVTPSHYARQHYLDALGLVCQRIPNVLDPQRIRTRHRGTQHVTFVNPQPTKGVYVVARVVQELERRRPDIPFLIVESRETMASLRQAGLDLAAFSNVRAMPNTPDPREFYRHSRIVLMPSLWDESFGLVAAEAMLNGIPVLASNRGALPEIVGDGGLLFDVPARYTPTTRDLPTAEEAGPWVAAIERLWDDRQEYDAAATRAASWAERYTPARLGPLYNDFFQGVVLQPGPPIMWRPAVAAEPGPAHCEPTPGT